ncbi:MAG: DUF3048 domain-containing protein [Candidatus Levybacteria bacterium]|nr:DUF3048 domain-containing protein [Candidatus Levybacteria bacterium]
MDKRKIITIFLSIFIFITAAIISSSIFSGVNKTIKTSGTSPVSSKSNPNGAIVFDQTQSKTEACPINGVLYSKQQKDWWEQHRPLGIMIENHEDARPQSGLSFADVVYEAVAEGSITRFLSVFYCQDAGIVGPVRSARTYFLDWISEYGSNPLYAHVGGANCNQETGSGCLNGAKADALGQISDYGWQAYNDLSQFNVSFPDYYQDKTRAGHEVATEHTVYSKTSSLWNVGKKRGLTNVDKEGKAWDENFVKYSFKDDASLSERAASQTIHLEPWEGFKQYAIDWIYDKTANVYKRNNAGKPHIDRDTNKQLTAKNIVVLEMVQSNANDGYDNNLHLLYKNKGTGKAYIFMDGKEIIGRWKKDLRTSRTLIYDSQSQAVKLNRGNIWFEILPTDGVLSIH